MKKNLLVVLVLVLATAVGVSFSLNAYAIHDLTVDGQRFPVAGADADKLYEFITMAKPKYHEWSHFPGTGDLYPAKNPHGPLVSMYMNKTAQDSMKDEKGMADGSIIVMENYASDKKLENCTVMYKIKGYNAEAGDWFWAKYAAPDGYVVASGKVQSCIGCHSEKKANDFLFAAK